MTPNLTARDREDEHRAPLEGGKHSYDGEPLTDYDSKTVVITAERNDNIEISNVETLYESDAHIPSALTVLKREQRYYGPELLLHSEVDEEDQNYLLTAPGPTKQLRLWRAELNERGRREGWAVIADVEAVLAAEQPPYERCDQCGEEIRTVEHERMAVLGRCQR